MYSIEIIGRSVDLVEQINIIRITQNMPNNFLYLCSIRTESKITSSENFEIFVTGTFSIKKKKTQVKTEVVYFEKELRIITQFKSLKWSKTKTGIQNFNPLVVKNLFWCSLYFFDSNRSFVECFEEIANDNI